MKDSKKKEKVTLENVDKAKLAQYTKVALEYLAQIEEHREALSETLKEMKEETGLSITTVRKALVIIYKNSKEEENKKKDQIDQLLELME